MSYFKIDRKITDWKFYDNPTALALWIHLLEKAFFQDGYYRGEPIRVGECYIGLRGLSQETGLAINTIREWLKKFEEEGQIAMRSTPLGTHISILNYEKYQNKGVSVGVSIGVSRIDTHTNREIKEEIKKEKEKKKKRKRKVLLPRYLSEEPEPEIPLSHDDLMKLEERLKQC